MPDTVASVTRHSCSSVRGYHKLGNEDRVTAVYDCFIGNGGDAISKQACSEATDSNPTNLLWVRNTFRGHFKDWQDSQEVWKYEQNYPFSFLFSCINNQ